MIVKMVNIHIIKYVWKLYTHTWSSRSRRKKRKKEKYEIIGPLLNWVFIALFIRQRENIGEIFYCDKCGIILLSKMVIDRVYVNVIEQFEIK